MSNVAVSFQSGVELSVVRFSVQEHLSAAFLIQIDALGEPDIDPRAIVGRAASFALQGVGGRRAWTGVCTRIAQTQLHGDTASYMVTLAPALWLLSRRRNYRVFQHLSVPEIATKLLADWGIQPVLRLTQGDYPKLEYRVQYGESDYNFLRRQLADAGISFFFTLDEDADTKAEKTLLVLTDAPHRGEPRADALPFVTDAGLSERGQQVSHVTVASEVRPGRVTLRDHDMRRPTYALLGQHVTRAEPESLLEEYSYEPGAAAVAGTADGTTPVGDRPAPYRHVDGAATSRARVVGESLRAGGLTVSLTTSVVDLAPGAVFLVTGHPHPAIASERGLLVLESSIGGEAQGEWSRSVVAVPAGEPFRPPQAVSPRAPDHTDDADVFASSFVPQKPRVHGIESAIVVGPQGEEIHTDELGRVRVQFHWDREGRFDQASSCWVRVSQAWAGAGFGATFLPRIGHEVMVAFIGGDPDLPVVVGRVHSTTMPAPHALPEHKTRSGLRSSSSPGGGGFNEIMFDDAKGQEVVSLRAERDLAESVNHDRNTRVGRIDTTIVGDTLRLFIADSQTGIEMKRGRIALTTGEATIILEGGEVSIVAKDATSVHSGNNLATPAWKGGATAKAPPAPPTAKPAPTSPGQRTPAPPRPATAPAGQAATAPAPRPQAQAQSGEPCVKLGKNKKFKPEILEASQRTGVPPHAIASMIDAEAAKKPNGEWNPESKATTSSAMGLTQFLSGTWKQMALRPGTLLHQTALDAGYVRPAGKGFEVAPGKLDELLALRSDPRQSIVAGAEYAKGNLDDLAKAGLVTNATTADEKARLAYLAHHEGSAGAKDFLRGTLSEERAAQLLRTNAGAKKADELIAENGSAKAAYQKWLNGYMDKKIVPSRYRCCDERVDGDEVPANGAAATKGAAATNGAAH
ncbi:Hypothetical protein A7982_02304 [Minicystis rosea]|nr:Hypothetical protein A7982_02304 [Minicystis rosea]